MTFLSTILMGFIAGATIAIGLPIGRMRAEALRFRALLNAIAIGVLLFLFIDVFSHALEPLSLALTDLHAHHGPLGPVVVDGALLIGGFVVGLLGLVRYQAWSQSRREKSPERYDDSLSPAARRSLMIAVGIGLHNFAEGLAIGAASRSGAMGLTTVLVIGFGLHNASEGFGIVAPLAGVRERATWKFLALTAFIGGGPTTLGTVVGWSNPGATISILFLSLAGGSILYVVSQLFNVAIRFKHGNILYYGLAIGLSTGFLTDMIVQAAGG